MKSHSSDVFCRTTGVLGTRGCSSGNGGGDTSLPPSYSPGPILSPRPFPGGGSATGDTWAAPVSPAPFPDKRAGHAAGSSRGLDYAPGGAGANGAPSNALCDGAHNGLGRPEVRARKLAGWQRRQPVYRGGPAGQQNNDAMISYPYRRHASNGLGGVCMHNLYLPLEGFRCGREGRKGQATITGGPWLIGPNMVGKNGQIYGFLKYTIGPLNYGPP